MILPVPGAEYDSSNEVQARRTIEQEDARNLKRSSGFWKPTLFGSTTAGAPTYVVQEGYWTRLDNTIIASFRVRAAEWRAISCWRARPPAGSQSRDRARAGPKAGGSLSAGLG